MTFNCPHCGCELNDDNGAPATCPKCGQNLAPAEPAPAPAADVQPPKRPRRQLNISSGALAKLFVALLVLLAIGAVVLFFAKTPSVEFRTAPPPAAEQPAAAEQTPAPAADSQPAAE